MNPFLLPRQASSLSRTESSDDSNPPSLRATAAPLFPSVAHVGLSDFVIDGVPLPPTDEWVPSSHSTAQRCAIPASGVPRLCLIEKSCSVPCDITSSSMQCDDDSCFEEFRAAFLACVDEHHAGEEALYSGVLSPLWHTTKHDSKWRKPKHMLKLVTRLRPFCHARFEANKLAGNGGATEMWCELYRPRSKSQAVCDPKLKHWLVDWLQQWAVRVQDESSKPTRPKPKRRKKAN